MKEKERKKQEEAEIKEKKKKEREETKKRKEEEQRKKAEERARKQEQKLKEKAEKEAQKAKKGKGKQPAGVGTKRSQNARSTRPAKCPRKTANPSTQINDSECCVCYISYDDDQSGNDAHVDDGCMRTAQMTVSQIVMGMSISPLFASITFLPDVFFCFSFCIAQTLPGKLVFW